MGEEEEEEVVEVVVVDSVLPLRFSRSNIFVIFARERESARGVWERSVGEECMRGVCERSV